MAHYTFRLRISSGVWARIPSASGLNANGQTIGRVSASRVLAIGQPIQRNDVGRCAVIGNGVVSRESCAFRSEPRLLLELLCEIGSRFRAEGQKGSYPAVQYPYFQSSDSKTRPRIDLYRTASSAVGLRRAQVYVTFLLFDIRKTPERMVVAIVSCPYVQRVRILDDTSKNQFVSRTL